MSERPDEAFFNFMRAALAGEPVAHDASGRATVQVTPLAAWQNRITPARLERLAKATVRRSPALKDDKGA